MPATAAPQKRQKKDDDSALKNELRERAITLCKEFKTSWVQLGQTLYAIHEDKMYYLWGYEKFEHYTKNELGLKKTVAMKMLKSYLFLEQDEPDYLKESFAELRESKKVPALDEINVLRLARNKNELTRQDYMKLKNAVFEKGKDSTGVRKDLTTMMKERKPVDPEEERENRNSASIKKMIESLRAFQKDMQALKLIPHELIDESETLMKKLKKQIS